MDLLQIGRWEVLTYSARLGLTPPESPIAGPTDDLRGETGRRNAGAGEELCTLDDDDDADCRHNPGNQRRMLP